MPTSRPCKDARKALREHLSQSLSSGEGSDCAVKCGSHVFLLHKFVLRQCDFFAAAFDHSWKEAEDSVVEFKEEEPYLMARLILWLYTSDYPATDVNDSKIAQQHPTHIVDPYCVPQDGTDAIDPVKICRLHLQMAALGDKYDRHDLVREAFRCFVMEFTCDEKSNNSHYAPPLYMATTQRLSLLQECCDTPGSCATLFETYALSVLHGWMGRDGLASAHVDALLRDCPDIAVGLATTRMSNREWRCNSCYGWTFILVRRCMCLKGLTGCGEKSCVDAIRNDNICRECFRVGTLNPPFSWP